MVGKLDQLGQDSEFDPHWLLYTLGLVAHLIYTSKFNIILDWISGNFHDIAVQIFVILPYFIWADLFANTLVNIFSGKNII